MGPEPRLGAGGGRGAGSGIGLGGIGCRRGGNGRGRAAIADRIIIGAPTFPHTAARLSAPSQEVPNYDPEHEGRADSAWSNAPPTVLLTFSA